MLITKPPDVSSSEITTRAVYVRRRDILRMFGIGTAVLVADLRSRAVAAGTHGKPLTVTSRMATTSDPPTPYDAVTTFNTFYEFGEEKDDPAKYSGAFKPSPWSVTVDGECAKPGTYALDD